MISENKNFKRRVAEHYDRESIVYDETRFVENVWYRRMMEKFTKSSKNVKRNYSFRIRIRYWQIRNILYKERIYPEGDRYL
ncbi:MAG: hypothetical protein QW791_07160 [Candidatus Bathyarchaeia archaeon]